MQLKPMIILPEYENALDDKNNCDQEVENSRTNHHDNAEDQGEGAHDKRHSQHKSR